MDAKKKKPLWCRRPQTSTKSKEHNTSESSCSNDRNREEQFDGIFPWHRRTKTIFENTEYGGETSGTSSSNEKNREENIDRDLPSHRIPKTPTSEANEKYKDDISRAYLWERRPNTSTKNTDQEGDTPEASVSNENEKEDLDVLALWRRIMNIPTKDTEHEDDTSEGMIFNKKNRDEDIEEIPEDPSPKLSREEYVQACIYGNEDIMKRIVSSIYEFKERFGLAVVSEAFGELIYKAEWILPTKQDTLKLTFGSSSTHVDTSFGSFSKSLNCSSHVSSWQQPHELMHALRQLLIAKKMVRHVIYGGWTHPNDRKEYGSYLTLTLDIAEHLDSFPNLMSLTLECENVDIDVPTYFESEECKFKNRITSLSFRGKTQEYWMAYLINPQLRNLMIREVDFKKLYVVRRLQALKLTLETMDIWISYFDDSIFTQLVILKFSNSCKKLGVHFLIFKREIIPKMALLAQSVDYFPNIYSTSWESDYAIDAAITLAYIFCLTETLEVFKCKRLTWDSTVLKHFTNRVAGKLMSLTIIEPQENECSVLKLFKTLIAELPKLQTFKFYAVLPWQCVSLVIGQKNLDDVVIRIINTYPEEMEILIQKHFVNFNKTISEEFNLLEFSKRKECLERVPHYPMDKWSERKSLLLNGWNAEK